MKITYDSEGDSMYIYLTEKPVERTVEISSRLFVDLDKEENLRGFEILFISKALKDTDFSHLEMQLPMVGRVALDLPIPA
ncbi:DUF2283 domain-containing protein [bacterium]|nr:DUF2283 domain-containing protein [bacterium]MBU1615404.1 DUF2283 domain-containing protein [bacterium]